MSEPGTRPPKVPPPPMADGEYSCKQIAKAIGRTARQVQLWMTEGLKHRIATIPGSIHPGKVATRAQVEAFLAIKCIDASWGEEKPQRKDKAAEPEAASIFDYSASAEDVAKLLGQPIDWAQRVAELQSQATKLSLMIRTQNLSHQQAKVVVDAQQKVLSEMRQAEKLLREEDERAGRYIHAVDADRVMGTLGSEVRNAIDQLKGDLPGALKVKLATLVPEDRQADVPRLVAEAVDQAIEKTCGALSDAAAAAAERLSEKAKQVA